MAGFNHPRILVSGATGQQGLRVICALLKRVPLGCIVAGVRSLDHEVARQLEARGVTVRLCDCTKPRTLRTALEGIDRVLLISSSAAGELLTQNVNVITAANAAGVGLLAYTSILRADVSPLSIGREHRITEVALKTSGIPYVLLRQGWYTENHAELIAAALRYGVVPGSAGKGRFSSASRDDFAEAAAIVLTTRSHAGSTYELAGDESYTLSELTAAIARAACTPVAYLDVPRAKLKQMLIERGMSETLAECRSDADAGASRGGLLDQSGALGLLLGRPTTYWRKTIERAAAALHERRQA